MTTRIPTEEERRARERKATGEKDREERVKVGAEEPGDPARRIVTGGSGTRASNARRHATEATCWPGFTEHESLKPHLPPSDPDRPG